MSTETQIETEILPAVRETQAVSPVQKEMDLPSLFKLAEALVPTGFLPEAIKTPGQAVAIILAGRELGIGPMLALRSIGIIRGKVVLAADLQLAQFKKFGGKAQFPELTEQKAVLWLKHPNGDEHTETFTIEDAKRAGLVRAGGNWTTFPKAMLRSRAITAGLKSLGFEPTCGAYDPDEAIHFQSEDTSGRLIDHSVVSSPVSEPKMPAKAKPVTNAGTPEEHGGLLALLRKRCGKLESEVVRFLQNVENKKGIILLLPTESLEDLKLEDLKALVNNWSEVYPKIEEWVQQNPAMDEDQIPGAEVLTREAPDPAIEEPQEGEFDIKKRVDSEWFWEIIIPVPIKGMKRDEYLQQPETVRSLYEKVHDDEDSRKRLWWLTKHWDPQPREWKGKIYNPTEADKKCREALDAFAEWHDKSK